VFIEKAPYGGKFNPVKKEKIYLSISGVRPVHPDAAVLF
jgi:hypothetical protein